MERVSMMSPLDSEIQYMKMTERDVSDASQGW